jgi:RNA polymerase sigma-54 factor
MQLRQDLRLRQEMTLQPQQILRSELIQLPLLELELRVRSELEENPFLEEGEDELEAVEVETPSEDTPEPAVIAEIEDAPEVREARKEREVDWEAVLNDEDQYEYKPFRQAPVEIAEIPKPATITLTEHLIEQLGFAQISNLEREIGEYIIGNINQDGYLDCSVEEIAVNINQKPERVLKVLKRIQQFDPVGISARDLKECLLIQLRNKDHYNGHAETILDNYFEDFKNKRFEIIAKKMEISLEEVKSAFEEIVKLNPKPGEGYFDEKQNYIIPDLVVTEVGGEFVVYLNDGNLPNFHINSAYRNMILQQKTTDKKVKEFLTRKLESARWFINAIHQRRTTMIRTMQAIVKKQEEFFRNGPGSLKPMILADIADEIDMDISTISRVTNGKYVQTDWGVFELKYFFSEKLQTDEGEDVSTKVIKAKIREIIDSENKKSPLSDQDIVDKLKESGYTIARRTAQKYREQMRSPIKRLRRQI